MQFNELCQYYQKLEATSKRLEMVEILGQLFAKLTPQEVEHVAFLTLGQLAPQWKTIEFGMSIKLILRAIATASGYDLPTIERFFDNHGDIGETAEHFLSRKRQKGLGAFMGTSKSLSISDVFETLYKLATTTGAGAQTLKHKKLVGLLRELNPLGSKYLAKIVANQMRLGVREATIIEGMTLARTGEKSNKSIVERACNLTGNLGYVGKLLWEHGLEALKEIQPEPLTPVKAMAANRVGTVSELFEKLGPEGYIEFKYDGIRVQVHHKQGTVAIFSRRLELLTDQFPELHQSLPHSLAHRDFIVEGEVVAIDPQTDRILPFQQVARRRRKTDIEWVSKEIPIRIHLFDLLYLDGTSYVDEPFEIRRQTLEQEVQLSDQIQLTRISRSSDPETIESFLQKALDNNCEGIMGKKVGPESVYQAGNRGWAWIKLKPDYVAGDSFDLVIVGGNYGKGKRAGTYGTLLMACYDDINEVFKTITQLGSGFTDEDLKRMKELLDPLRLSEQPKDVIAQLKPDVWFEPKYVLSIVGTELSRSAQHTACRGFFEDEDTGIAIRFPRILNKEFVDKTPEQCTTEQEIWEMFKIQNKKRSSGNEVIQEKEE